MRLHVMLRYVGFILLLNSLGMLFSALVSLYYGDNSFIPLLYSALVLTLFGVFPLIYVQSVERITNNEGLLIVIASWLVSCLAGTLPYILWGGEFDFTNAWFESVSGFTTTGSSILTDIEAVPHGLLFWRAMTHWLGGMGIIIFALSIMPFMGAGTKVLYQSEMSPLARDNFQQRAKNTIQILVKVYIGLTALETLALMVCGMSLFDAITHSFATIATGGFSPKNNSVAYYDSVAVETVIMVFMILSGLNFVVLFSAIFGKFGKIWSSSAARYYLGALFVGILISTINIHGNEYQGWGKSLRFASFQILSVGTSTGFATADSSIWPALSQILIVFFSLQCACAGSTSGGIKVDRIVILWKAFVREIRLLQHPQAIIPVLFSKQPIEEEAVGKGTLYITLYIAIVFVSTILLVAIGMGSIEAFSGTVATIGNVGPGLGSVGSTGNFGHIPTAGKWILSATMLLGRLEIYALIRFFMPNHWKMYSAF
jgi:trk system potassium uptake protein TrkH